MSKEAVKERIEEEEKEEFWETCVGLAAVVAVVALVLWYVNDEEDNKIQNEKDCKSKAFADSIPGDLVDNDGRLKRVPQTQRLSLQALEASGVRHGGLEGTLWKDGDKYYQQTYWNDEAAYELSFDAALKLRNATYELHSMCLEAVDLIVGKVTLIALFK